MADETLQTIPLENNIDAHIVTLFERLEAIRRDNQCNALNNRLSSTLQPKRSMQAEIRTLEFWRSIISECLASFFYVFIVCGAAAGAGVGASVSSVLLATALASGLAMGTLTQCFLHISGAHINPAVTLASCVIRSISPLRAAMYITAQCGGGIAGAALLYGVTVPGYQGNLQAAISHSATLAAWERFGVEFILTFVVVLTYFVSTDSVKKVMGHSASSIAAAYSACSFVSMPYLNPARSLGPSFVLNKWDNHWVYWFGPLVGGIASGIVYEFIFSTKRNARHIKASMDNESSSMNSDDELNYDLDLEKQNMQTKYTGTFQRGQNANVPQQTGPAPPNGNAGNGNYCQNLYTAPPKFDQQQEPLYGGTRSMYCRSPTLTRTNLNRSQSVYAKSNTAINRDIVPRSGPLVPAQSLYRMNQQVNQQQQQQQHQQQQQQPHQQQQQHQQSSHLQNQNVQNQMQQRSESIYGVRSANRQSQPPHQGQMPHHLNGQLMQHQPPPQPQGNQQQQQQQHQQQHLTQPPQDSGPQSFQSVYGTRQNPNPTDGNIKFERRPESVYGMTVPRNRGQSAQSDDSSYGSYHGSSMTPPARIPSTEPPMIMYAPPPQPNQHQVSSATNPPPIRTQSERKVSTPVVVSQAASMTSTTTTMGQFSTSQGAPAPHSTQPTTQQQQQQQQMMAQHHQQQQQQQPPTQQPPPPAHPQQHNQHYGMLPMRPN